ncbi:hypothetical protein [Sphingobacterium thalpophilum]|uniref:hypothetical protein n=1 Tax=Sphingobacterium thalpophilum TaxID=259 RepID=UPI003D97969D
MNWNCINDKKLPKDTEPVFLAKKPTHNLIEDCLLGIYIPKIDNGRGGWLVGDNGDVITLSSRPYWTLLNVEVIGMPNTENDTVLTQYLDQQLGNLASFEKRFQKLSQCMMLSEGGNVYPLDIFISGIISRSLSLIYGFETLINSSNFLAAAHLVRPHLDNFLRLFAAWQVSTPHDFATSVSQGEPIRKMKDREGKYMTEAYLKELATKEYDWIASVYNATSGFIHFSEKHIKNATSLSDQDEGVFNTFIGKMDHKVSDKSKLEATFAMIEISNCIALQIYGYIETKRMVEIKKSS